MSPQRACSSAPEGEAVNGEWNCEEQGGPRQKDWDQGAWHEEPNESRIRTLDCGVKQ